MKCISQVDGIEILREIHEGECGHHAAARSLVAKAFRHGFYWPTAKADADHIVVLCQGYQMHSKQIHMPTTTLHMIPITWPFTVWELDMVGPLKIAPSGFTHLLVAVDKFTKWVEAKPIRKHDGKTALKFVKDIVVRFGIPHSIITDNLIFTNWRHQSSLHVNPKKQWLIIRPIRSLDTHSRRMN
jgi:hypothetical protein